ncbi:MAG: hypothetical protein QM770_09590 [Tepidisphaeraceae bacterium]
MSAQMIFITLPVADLAKSKAFFAGLGFAFNPQYESDGGACMVVSENILVMLATHEQFKRFSPLPIADATKVKEALFTITRESRAAVDETVAQAVKAGATTFEEPEDHGFMYASSFIDLDGHGWNLIWLNPAGAPKT